MAPFPWICTGALLYPGQAQDEDAVRGTSPSQPHAEPPLKVTALGSAGPNSACWGNFTALIPINKAHREQPLLCPSNSGPQRPLIVCSADCRLCCSAQCARKLSVPIKCKCECLGGISWKNHSSIHPTAVPSWFCPTPGVLFGFPSMVSVKNHSIPWPCSVSTVGAQQPGTSPPTHNPSPTSPTRWCRALIFK